MSAFWSDTKKCQFHSSKEDSLYDFSYLEDPNIHFSFDSYFFLHSYFFFWWKFEIIKIKNRIVNLVWCGGKKKHFFIWANHQFPPWKLMVRKRASRREHYIRKLNIYNITSIFKIFFFSFTSSIHTIIFKKKKKTLFPLFFSSNLYIS